MFNAENKGRVRRNIQKICRHFLDALFPPHADEIFVRELRYSMLRTLAAPVTEYASGAPLLAMLPYRLGIVQAVVREAKFSGNVRAQMLLGKILAEHIVKILEFSNKTEEGMRSHGKIKKVCRKVILVPLPLGKKRLKERGYNQVQKIVECALPYLQHIQHVQHFQENDEKGFEVEMHPALLTRTRETTPQTSLGRNARLANMQHAFKIPDSIGQIESTYLYIVVDDVLTTGATLLAASDALRAAGAKRVLAIALAH
jgi:predicted amidophosphoribosyltransferase